MTGITKEDRIRKREQLFEALSKESDRGLILVAASFFDNALEALLRATFSMRHPKMKSAIDPLFDALGPLSNFSAKIRLCYAMDLIQDWIYHDLEVFRKLRNSFAHTIEPVQFDSSEIVALTETLQGADLAVTLMARNEQYQTTQNNSQVPNEQQQFPRSPKATMERARVTLTVCHIGGTLHFQVQLLTSDLPIEAKTGALEAFHSHGQE